MSSEDVGAAVAERDANVFLCVIAMRQPLKGRRTATDRPETFLIAITHHNGKELCFN